MTDIHARRKCVVFLLFVALLAGATMFGRSAKAHEMLPTIADFGVSDEKLVLTMFLDIEALMAGLDLSSTTSAKDVERLAAYDELRALSVETVGKRFEGFWPTMSKRISVNSDGVALKPTLLSLTPPANSEVGLARIFSLNMTFALPAYAQAVTIGWDPAFGPLVLRQTGVTQPYEGYIDPGTVSPPIQLSGGDAPDGWTTFLRYVPVGFEHIVPRGLDHILFVLGLFLFSTRLRPLLLQVSVFTAAHTITLAAAAANVVVAPPSIVEPAIAASIVYIAIENIFAKGVSPFRLPVVFLFGLLHGLGFASVLREFGLPADSFLAALLGFNIGVELGQLAIVATAFLFVGLWFNRHRLYRVLIVVPGSALIGITGAIWVLQRIA